ncbi:MAG: glycosyltransferase [Gemmataceae bacterium]|nr:glycosyltransferase [Gemmataceae bacterium]
MRIVHVIASLDPAQGGPPVVARNLAAAQAGLGHDVRLAAEVVVGTSSVPTITLPRHTASVLWQQPTAAALDLVRNADVLHLHGIWEPVLLTVARAARSAGVPYVIAPHGMLDPWSLSQKKWKKRLALTLGFRRMLNRAAGLHVLNSDERDLLAPLRLTSPCFVIPNGIFLAEFDPPPDPQRFRDRRPGPGDRPFILFLSRLHYKKGLDLLAEAFSKVAPRHPDVDLVVAGPDGGAETDFRNRIAGAGLNHRVWLTGPLYGPEKLSALSAARLFCLPSRQEGFSMAILEALACQLPVVITKDCHFPEVAAEGAGRVTSLSPDAIADALDGLLSSPEERNSAARAGRALVEGRFTWPRIAEQTIRWYVQLGQPGPGVVN